MQCAQATLAEQPAAASAFRESRAATPDAAAHPRPENAAPMRKPRQALRAVLQEQLTFAQQLAAAGKLAPSRRKQLEEVAANLAKLAAD